MQRQIYISTLKNNIVKKVKIFNNMALKIQSFIRMIQAKKLLKQRINYKNRERRKAKLHTL